MLFGKSLFQSVVERLAEEAEEADDLAHDPAYRIAGLSSGFVAESIGTAPTQAFRLDAYLALMPDERPAVNEPPVIPNHLLRLTIEEIAEDLGITERDDRQSLAEKRRAFARLNPPDGVKPEFRHKATLRMTAANLLIDQAIRMLKT